MNSHDSVLCEVENVMQIFTFLLEILYVKVLL